VLGANKKKMNRKHREGHHVVQKDENVTHSIIRQAAFGITTIAIHQKTFFQFFVRLEMKK
jgi:hypothetical protein